MGLLSQIETAPAEEKSAGAPWRNVAVRVVSYDVPNRTTTGVDISTGEAVKIKLDDQVRSGREDVDVWSAKRFGTRGKMMFLENPKAVVAGDESDAGVIIFEAVRPSKTEGVMEARWAVTASHSATDASVLPVMARPIASKNDAGQVNPNFGIEIVRPITAAPVTSVAEITEQIKSVVGAAFTQAVVRAQDDDGKVLSAVVRRPFTDELKALTAKVNAAGQEAEAAKRPFSEIRAAKTNARAALAEQFAAAEASAIDQAGPAFFRNDPLGKLIAKLDEEQLKGLRLEVFSLEQVYPGSKYKEAIGKEGGTDGSIFRRDYSVTEGEKNVGFGFAETYVALRQHEEGGTQYTKFRPTSTRPMLYLGLNDIPTPNIQPAAAPVASKSAQAAQDDPARAPSVAASSEAAAAPAAAEGLTLDSLNSSLAKAARTFAR